MDEKHRGSGKSRDRAIDKRHDIILTHLGSMPCWDIDRYWRRSFLQRCTATHFHSTAHKCAFGNMVYSIYVQRIAFSILWFYSTNAFRGLFRIHGTEKSFAVDSHHSSCIQQFDCHNIDIHDIKWHFYIRLQFDRHTSIR